MRRIGGFVVTGAWAAFALGAHWIPVGPTIVVSAYLVMRSMRESIKATHDEMLAVTVRELAEATRQNAHLLQPHVRQARPEQDRRAILGCPQAAL
jgi:hypothetical protein